MPRPGLHAKGPAQQLGTLTHACQAEVSRRRDRRRIEARPAVRYLEAQQAAITLQLHAHVDSSSVTGRVRERFLERAKEGDLDRVRRLARQGPEHEVHRRATPLLVILGSPFGNLAQRACLELGEPDAGGDRAHVLQAIRQRVVDNGEVDFQLVGPAGGASSPGNVQSEERQRQRLPRPVVARSGPPRRGAQGACP